jgi:hypothetical protein
LYFCAFVDTGQEWIWLLVSTTEEHANNVDYGQENDLLLSSKPWISYLTSNQAGAAAPVSSVSKAKRRLKRLLSIDRKHTSDAPIFYCDNLPDTKSDSTPNGDLSVKKHSTNFPRSQSSDDGFFLDNKSNGIAVENFMIRSYSTNASQDHFKRDSSELEPLAEIPDLPEILKAKHPSVTNVILADEEVGNSEHSSLEPLRCAPSPTASSCYSSCDEERKSTLSQGNMEIRLNQLTSTTQIIKTAGGSLRSVARSCSPTGSVISTCPAIRGANSVEQIAPIHSTNFATLLGSADSGLADSGSVDSLALSALQSKTTLPTERKLIVSKLRCRPILRSIYASLQQRVSVKNIDLTNLNDDEKVIQIKLKNKFLVYLPICLSFLCRTSLTICAMMWLTI